MASAGAPRPSHAQVISKTLIHLMERPPGRTSRHIERIIGSQKTLRLQDLLILATDTESLHPDIDTDIVLLFLVWKSNFGRPAPSTRCYPRDAIT